ncbi:hypothetical protein ACRE_024670 [Hapsidospora chrysogenum ATCC 11550]|uniref:Uncharacterized protein n=1 Tax=Hapsidospora chrysogenum (strain ATCC 11550 / CBS 779.69 / DSM 880 / IAM 14645 / JCM 23072 / IMI 49137) TaxID=857340 RepID=A0A086TBI5_HAPC1|nr:hypothetical protein ACRE_024670 [Hapsidospora chrysogenum ATCC 11550]
MSNEPFMNGGTKCVRMVAPLYELATGRRSGMDGIAGPDSAGAAGGDIYRNTTPTAEHATIKTPDAAPPTRMAASE